ncbi:MAG: 50S ribosomal protein L24, partial [Rhodospirillales bacterium]|nr:50S ribosomal protein L24 [Rhodospirillales bacterium]
MATKIKKGDRVQVLTGKSKGLRGEVLKVITGKDRAVVQGVNMIKRHTKPNQAQPGGIIEKEAPVHVSNLAHIDPKTDKPTRVGFKT